MSFNNFKLHPILLDNIKQLGYAKPTPIQEKAIPEILSGKDVLGIAKTGSGKTASFVLPVLNTYIKRAKVEKSREPKVLVLVPTRELAIQVADVFLELSNNFQNSIKVLSIYGGVSINPQMKALYGVDILVATPGRLLDLHRSNALVFSKIEKLILDEADKMLNLGFEKEMQDIFDLLPKHRQNILFSATLNDQLSGLNKVLLNDPAIVKIEARNEDAELINLMGYFVSDDRKGPLLRHLIKEKEMQQVLVFTSSGAKADRVADKLNKNGINAKSIHGKKNQSVRTRSLQAFKSGKLQVLVSTDLISRGIDIHELPFVINYELPRSPKDFVHRVGRTGRANNEGLAITFVTRDETHHFKVILKKMKRYMEMIDSEEMEF